jgi:hypothetical protein
MVPPADPSEVSPAPAPRLEERIEAPVLQPAPVVSSLASPERKETPPPANSLALVGKLISYLGVLGMLMGAATSVFCWMAFRELEKPHDIPVVFQFPEAPPPPPAAPVGLWAPLTPPGAVQEPPSQRPIVAATILLQPQPLAAAACTSHSLLPAPKRRPDAAKGAGLRTETKYVPDRGPEVFAYQLLARSFAMTLGGLAICLFGWGLGRPTGR